MIAHLRGIVHKMEPGEVSVDTEGVGYAVRVPVDFWDELQEGDLRMFWISSYIREDRFDLYGFRDREGKIMFEECLKLDGVGPKLGLELLAAPRSLLRQAMLEDSVSLLMSIKGVGKRTAEKLLVELRALAEKKPMMFDVREGTSSRGEFDQDAIAALTALGYDSMTAIHALKGLPPTLKNTEDRVAAALRTL